ncbi:uncharacterized protein LOC123311664 [Coccinella septempunctata]|uniref:uncharacterized protein LOC123311664 n=1 Tax=Coccinella septempunctata TaxID=41139 RepID=UPI001D086555|nr:uncharacterized protein LOC123311664 [Coccinella septempunctata]
MNEVQTHSTDASVRRDRRTRWTEEDNILILRVHFIAKDLQQREGRNYREVLTQIWNEINPHRQSYTNLLSNRVRWLLENNKFSNPELDTIKESFIPRGATDNEQDELEDDEEERNGYQISMRTTKLERNLLKNIYKYYGLSPKNRPKIPRMKGSKKLLECVQRVDLLLETHITPNTTLQTMVDYVYAGAITICEELGMKIGEFPMAANPIVSTPPWKTRLERKIKVMRKKIGTLHTYLNNGVRTKRVIKGINQIIKDFKINPKSSTESLQLSLLAVDDRLKQKVKSLGNRIKRYNDRVKRFKNNQLYYKNQKEFFRSLEPVENLEGEYPTEKNMYDTWKRIWEQEEQHDDDAYWIKNAENEIHRYTMDEVAITVEDVWEVMKKSNNWSAPGSDKIHNYWWKNFKSTHQQLAVLFHKALDDPTTVPNAFTAGVTHMIPKGNNINDPKKYRPITCLPTVYKFLTGVLTKHIWRHVNKHQILSREQNGCRKNAQGCKELLTIDCLITKQAKKKMRNISIAWIDYKKAFDSVPHSWLLKILKLYGVSQNIINLLEYLMKTWRTHLSFGNKQENIKTAEIKIKRGIFQGDKLSALWFCLALNFLSKLLNEGNYGYAIDKIKNIRITHQLYVDDLKLYATNEEQLMRLLRIVASFSQTIRMEMGLDKCAVIHVKRGRLVDGEEMLVQDGIAIQRLAPEETYKYLGVQQALEIRTSDAKASFQQKFFDRVKKILKSKLNSKAMFTAINIWAVPSLTYSFGVIKWSNTELKAIDTKVRVLMSKYGIHHPHASVNRLYMPRHSGGRGLQNIEITHQKAVNELRKYFHSRNSPFFKTICREDHNITALNLRSTTDPPRMLTLETMSEEWHSKPLHGRYPAALKEKRVNQQHSLTYLTSGYLFPETEGRITAIQDQVIPTRAYLKHITGKNILTDRCRKCCQALETIQHITSSCSILAPKEYTNRHNAMAKVYHQAIAIKTGLINSTKKIHEYVPATVLDNQGFKLYWDNSVETDRMITHNRPDIILFDKEKRKVTIIDVTVPADDNISRAYSEKLNKYHDLAFEMKEMYQLKTISILPLIITTNGLVESHLVDNTQSLELDLNLISIAQKEVILWTARIVRMFLTTT